MKSRKDKIKLIQQALAGKMPKQYATILELDETSPGNYRDDKGNQYNDVQLEQRVAELKKDYDVVFVEIAPCFENRMGEEITC